MIAEQQRAPWSLRASILVVSALSFGVPAAGAQDLVPGEAPAPERELLVGASVHPVSGPALEPGFVLIEDGRIAQVGAGTPETSAFDGVPRVDLKGLQLWPGLIQPSTRLGLVEISGIRQSTDLNEVGAINPEAHAAVAVNPDSTLIPVARLGGVLTAGVFPEGGLIPGRSSVMRLGGWTNRDMTLRSTAGLAINWPRARTIRAWWMDQSEAQQRRRRAEEHARLNRVFEEAAAYLVARRADESLPVDLAKEGMRAFLPGPKGEAPTRPLFVRAQDSDQIQEAMDFGARHGVQVVIVGGREARQVAQRLARERVPVIVLGTLRTPRRSDLPYDWAYRLPAALAQAGVPFCLATGQDPSDDRNLSNHAGMAAAHGLDRALAMRAITLSAAEVLGVADEIGSLEKGKAATLIATEGHPLEVVTRVRHAWLDGRRVVLESKQTALAAKFRQKYRWLEEEAKRGR